MRLNDIIDVVLLLIAGLIFHIVFPGIYLADGMKPDFSLAVLFVILLLKRNWYLITTGALFIGIYTSMTSSVTSGQWFNLIDKLITAQIMYLIINHFREHIYSTRVHACLIACFGTIVSCMVFGFFAINFGGLTPDIKVMFFKVLLPSLFMNVGATYVIYVAMEYSEMLCLKN